MYCYKINNSYTVYVNFCCLNECIKAGRRGSFSKSSKRPVSSAGNRVVLKDTVGLGSKVRVMNVDTKEESVFNIASSADIHSKELAITKDSPVGKALMQHCAGETICVVTPSGKINYEILGIRN